MPAPEASAVCVRHGARPTAMKSSRGPGARARPRVPVGVATRSTRSYWLASESLRAFSAQRQRTAELSTALKLALRLETL